MSPTPLATWDTDMYSTAGGLPTVQTGNPGNLNESRHRSDTSRIPPHAAAATPASRTGDNIYDDLYGIAESHVA